MKEDLKEDLEEEPSKEEEEEPLAPAVSASSLPDSVSAYEETQPFEEDEVAAPAPPLPPPSPLSPLSSPLPRIPSPPLLLPPPTHKDSIPEADMPPWRRARFAALSYRFEIGESSAAAAARQPGREAWTLAMDRLREMQIEVRDLQQQRRDQSTKTVVHDAAYGMPWKTLMKMMTKNYCSGSEIKKLETELWNLTIKGTDVESYTQRFQELVVLCSRMVLDESDKVEKYTGGLPNSIQGSAMASKPKMLQEMIELAKSLMDQKVLTYAARQAENKRRIDNNSRSNHVQQPPEISDCPKLKNKDRGNATGNGEARGRAYALGGGEANPDLNVVTGTFLLNNCYASILFDTGADRSFVSVTFSSLIDIAPSTLDNSYDVELADEKIIGVDTIIQGCTLNLLNHPFNIDLMPVELGSFDATIGMDWLSMYHAVIVIVSLYGCNLCFKF
ncbi:putative reverse transcriptase domain-containing protein [Tanacetum coccineum]|uniref:Reverse transcriptase domain-containing protein n=1 Tax=Tanacetum coccineum TaxID=301880 RepID=A0ABQ5JAN6_9ASTR